MSWVLEFSSSRTIAVTITNGITLYSKHQRAFGMQIITRSGLKTRFEIEVAHYSILSGRQEFGFQWYRYDGFDEFIQSNIVRKHYFNSKVLHRSTTELILLTILQQKFWNLDFIITHHSKLHTAMLTINQSFAHLWSKMRSIWQGKT